MRTITALAVLLLSTPLVAQSALDRAASAMANKEASFTQSFTPKGFKTSQTESGSVIFGNLPMMRWSYAKPEQKLFVFDGRRSWFYVPADKQVTIGDIDDARRKEIPFLVFGDRAAREKLFTIKQQNRGKSVITTLQPKDGAAMVRSVTVTIGADNLIQRVEYTDREGNRTAFNFSGYHPRAATAETFRFSPPAGVQVVNAD